VLRDDLLQSQVLIQLTDQNEAGVGRDVRSLDCDLEKPVELRSPTMKTLTADRCQLGASAAEPRMFDVPESQASFNPAVRCGEALLLTK
jgi:hypothetical protein